MYPRRVSTDLWRETSINLKIDAPLPAADVTGPQGVPRAGAGIEPGAPGIGFDDIGN
jgi:hypothetical protein